LNPFVHQMPQHSPDVQWPRIPGYGTDLPNKQVPVSAACLKPCALNSEIVVFLPSLCSSISSGDSMDAHGIQLIADEQNLESSSLVTTVSASYSTSSASTLTVASSSSLPLPSSSASSSPTPIGIVAHQLTSSIYGTALQTTAVASADSAPFTKKAASVSDNPLPPLKSSAESNPAAGACKLSRPMNLDTTRDTGVMSRFKVPETKQEAEAILKRYRESGIVNVPALYMQLLHRISGAHDDDDEEPF